MAGEGDRLKGTVAWFDRRKGFGFISPDEGDEDIFVHNSSIKTVGYRSLTEGEVVEFVVSVGNDGRRRAVSVTGPGGAYIKSRRYDSGCREVGPMAINRKSKGSSSRLGPCYTCGAMGHLARQCLGSILLDFSKAQVASPLNFVNENSRTLSDNLLKGFNSNEDYEFPRGVEERNWAELPRDVLSVIFKKITTVEVITCAQYVCRPWRQLSYDPELWRGIKIFVKNFNWKQNKLNSIAMVAVERSKGCLEEFYSEFIGKDNLMNYISERSSQLRCLRLISVTDISFIALAQAVRRFPLLEEFEVTACTFSCEVVELVGKACPLMKNFKFNAPDFTFGFHKNSDVDDDTAAFAISKHMQQLRHLQLIGTNITEVGLLAILNNCTNLHSLDIRKCINVYLDKTMKKKISLIKDVRLPNESTADYEFNEIISDVLDVFSEDFDPILTDSNYDYDEFYDMSEDEFLEAFTLYG